MRSVILVQAFIVISFVGQDTANEVAIKLANNLRGTMFDRASMASRFQILTLDRAVRSKHASLQPMLACAQPLLRQQRWYRPWSSDSQRAVAIQENPCNVVADDLVPLPAPVDREALVTMLQSHGVGVNSNHDVSNYIDALWAEVDAGETMFYAKYAQTQLLRMIRVVRIRLSASVLGSEWVLVERRKNGRLQLPSGKLLPGESPSVGALRELQEEIGQALGEFAVSQFDWSEPNLTPVLETKVSVKYPGFKTNYVLYDVDVQMPAEIMEQLATRGACGFGQTARTASDAIGTREAYINAGKFSTEEEDSLGKSQHHWEWMNAKSWRASRP